MKNTQVSWKVIVVICTVAASPEVAPGHSDMVSEPYEPQPQHALIMARFAGECRIKMNELVAELENRLGPDTGDLSYVKVFVKIWHDPHDDSVFN